MCWTAAACGDGQSSNPPAQTPPTVEADFDEMWSTVERVQRRTCPSERCGVVGQVFFRELVRVFEQRDGWARISEPYSASCVDGRSEIVDRGESACSVENGIVDGLFSEWVRLEDIATVRPPDPVQSARIEEELIAGSDDFGRHRRAFVTAANALIADGRCTPSDFQEMGGWLKSSNHRDQPIYFTYCGGMTLANRIYLDASSGRIFKE